jgi:uncharacterized protein (TIGR03083 family)
MPATDLMPMVHKERQMLADFLETLTPEQWQAPTWCAKWNVQQVTGHVIAASRITAPHFIKMMVTNGFSFDKFVEKDLEKYAAGTPKDVMARYSDIITSNRKPPGPAYVGLGEVMLHGDDIRRALGAASEHPAEHLAALAPLYVKTGKPLNGKVRSAGLKLRATDIDWTHGDGPEVAGPAMSILQAVTGRKQALADLEGPGVETLRGR